MSFGLEKIPENGDEYAKVLRENFHHFVMLQKICGRVTGCGSYMVGIQNLDWDHETYEKQKALYDYSKGKERILEIGFYAGHSALIMLLANPSLDFRMISVDVCYFNFTEKCAQYLKSQFPRQFYFVKEHSLTFLPEIGINFDLIHLDGDHGITNGMSVCEKELTTIKMRNKNKNVTIVLDDRDATGVKKALETHKNNLDVLYEANCKWPNGVYKLI